MATKKDLGDARSCLSLNEDKWKEALKNASL